MGLRSMAERYQRPAFVIAVARTSQREASNAIAGFSKTVEGLACIALETCRFGAGAHCGIQGIRKLALVDHMRNEARALRTGLAELDVHGISQDIF